MKSGLPLTILRLKDEEVAVVEMGMNHFNEMSRLTQIAKPDLAIITNIGTSHIGNLGSRENILKAKLEILEGMDKKEIVINNDNDMLQQWKDSKLQDNDIKIHTFGIENLSQVWADQIRLQENESTFTCHIGEEQTEIRVAVGGKHFIYNALCAVIVGNILGIETTKIKQGIESFELTKKRMEITKLDNGATIINDAYNASLESIQEALKNLSSYKQHRKIVVLGDIFELGEYAEQIHRKVGDIVGKSSIDILICCGENSKYIIEEVRKSNKLPKKIYYFNNIEQIKEYLKKNLQNDDVALIKASNGMNFWKILPL